MNGSTTGLQGRGMIEQPRSSSGIQAPRMRAAWHGAWGGLLEHLPCPLAPALIKLARYLPPLRCSTHIQMLYQCDCLPIVFVGGPLPTAKNHQKMKISCPLQAWVVCAEVPRSPIARLPLVVARMFWGPTVALIRGVFYGRRVCVPHFGCAVCPVPLHTIPHKQLPYPSYYISPGALHTHAGAGRILTVFCKPPALIFPPSPQPGLCALFALLELFV